MPFCKFSSELIFSNSTKVDNIFIETYLPAAPALFVKLYLYGLYKCGHSSSADNTIESFAKVLKMTDDEIIEGYKYWESENLVTVVNLDPIEIKYLEPKRTIENYKLRDVNKYHDFNLQMQAVIEGRMISSNEYLKYYVLLESFHIEEMALVMVAKYCTNLKGADINAEYIIKVATSWAYAGIKSVADVEAKISDSEKSYGKLKDVLTSLGINRIASLDERDMFEDWQKKLGFTFDIIYAVSKTLKGKASFNKLNSKLVKYASLNLFSIKEIESFEKQSKENLDLTKEIVKNLSLYFENLQTPSEIYIVKWLAEGFSSELLIQVSKLCFKQNLKSLEQMDAKLNTLYKLGITNNDSFAEYTNDILATDKEIKEILAAVGILRDVNSFDRSFYRTWTYTWKFNKDAILYVASLSAGAVNVMQYMNKVLSNLKEQNIFNIEDIKKQNLKFESVKAAPKTAVKNYKEHDYSKEDLNALFSNLDDVLTELK